MMMPLLFNLNDKTALVIGGGQVAARKISALLGNGARVVCVSPWRASVEAIFAVSTPTSHGALNTTADADTPAAASYLVPNLKGCGVPPMSIILVMIARL